MSAQQNAAVQFELQESPDPQFRQVNTLYRGPDLATLLSGRSDGLRYYRVRAIGDDGAASPWSATRRVETRHHPLSRALMFFAVGAVVFVSTLAFILAGHRAQARDRQTDRT